MRSFDSLDSVDSANPIERAGEASTTQDVVDTRVELTRWRQLSLSALWLGINAISAALLPIVLPIQILLFVAPGTVGGAQQAQFLGWLSAGGAVIALVVPPLVGALSDRTTLAYGRRRPYMLVGVLVSVLGAWTLATANDLSMLVATFLLIQFGFNLTVGAYQGLLPDLTPERQRGAASGYMGLMTILGNVGSLALAGALLADVTLADVASSAGRARITSGAIIFYGATAVALVVTAVVTLVWTPETPITTTEVAALRPKPRGGSRLERGMQSLRALWLEPWKSHNFTWVFLTRAFVMLGLTLFLTFIEYYFANVAQIANFVSATAVVAGLALVGAMVSALALGILSDRMNRTLLVGVSSAFMAIPAILFVVAPGSIPLWPLGLVFGLGYGAYTSVDWALAVDVLPVQANAGKDLGIWSAASTLPAVLAPALGGVVIGAVDAMYHQTALGYRAVFALAAIFLALGALFVSFIRDERAPQAPTAGGDATPEGQRQQPGRGWRLASGSRGGQARGFLRFWPVWEWVTRTLQPVSPIPDAPNGLLGAQLARYRGRPITLPDGTQVAQGDWVINLHFDNHRLSAAARTASLWRLARMIGEDMGALARWVATPGEMAQARALVGVTLMGRAAPRLGFTVRERPITLHAQFERFFMQGLMAIYNPEGVRRLERGTTYAGYPVEVWMSRAKLLRRYGSPAPASTPS